MQDQNKDEKLIGAVRQAYSAAADRPQDRHAFPVGRLFAESVGYPRDLLDGLPEQCVEAFAGVSNLGITAEITDGSVVLDLGCGAREGGPSCGNFWMQDSVSRSYCGPSGTREQRIPLWSGWMFVRSGDEKGGCHGNKTYATFQLRRLSGEIQPS